MAFVACILIALSAAVDVRVTTVDEQTVAGALTNWDTAGVELSTPEGATNRLETEQILRVDLPTAEQTPLTAPALVTLVDGSTIAVAEFTSNKDTCQVEMPQLGDSSAEVKWPLSAVQSVRLMPTEAAVPEIASQWKNLLQTNAAGDLIVIRKPGAANLNYVEGTLGDSSEQSVQFTLDGDTLDVSRAKVFGVVYFRGPASESTTAPRAMVTGPGLKLAVESAQLDGDMVVAKSSLLGELRLPLSAVKTLDFSIDRVQYLSDLEPLQAAWTPSEFTAPIASLLGGVARDRGFYSSTLELECPASSLPTDEISTAGLPKRLAFTKGLAVRSKSDLSYKVPKGFVNFRATVGIDPETSTTGDVSLKILGDDKVLFDQAIRGGEAPVEIECNVDGMRKLELIVDYDGNGPTAGTGDNLHLGAARFTK